MNKLIATATAACLALSGAAHAASITVSAFTIDEFDSVVGSGDFVIEDFEAIGEAFVGATGIGTSGVVGSSLGTSVGTFSALGGLGDGDTCDQSLGDCSQLSLFNTDPNGQGNLVPYEGIWSLNANDTFGIMWDVFVDGGASFFNRVVFAMMDAADQGATVTVTSGDDKVTFNDELNANQQLIVIDFGAPVYGASVEIRSTSLNDSFSIDGASVGVVPLPAGGLLLLTGFGALALRRRRKAA